MKKSILIAAPKQTMTEKGVSKVYAQDKILRAMRWIMRFWDVFFKILLVWEQELLNCVHENTNFT